MLRPATDTTSPRPADQHAPAPSEPRVWPPWSVALFALILGLFATYFLGDQMGKHSDDWYIGRRDLATNEVTRWSLHMIDQTYWRPLHCTLTCWLQTALWNHDWAIHLVLTITHILVSAGVYRLMREIGFAWRLSTAAAILFLTYPATHEAYFWAAAWMYGWATLGFIALAVMQVRFSRSDLPMRWGRAIGLFALGHLIPCANEQPMMGILALPLLGLSVASTHHSPRRRVLRAIAPGFIAGLGSLLYLALMAATVAPHQRGSLDTLLPLSQVPAQAQPLFREAGMRLTLSSFAHGAFTTGLHELAAHPLRTLGSISILFAATLLAARRWLNTSLDPSPSVSSSSCFNSSSPAPSPPTLRPLPLAIFGLALFALNWLPMLLLSGAGAESRTSYSPFLGALITAAAACHALMRARRYRPHPQAPLLLGVITLLLGLSGAICLIGTQAVYRNRYRMDLDLAAQLRQLVPAPPTRTFFMPVELLSVPAATGSRRFDRAACAMLENPFTAPVFLHRTYGRADVTATHAGGWNEPGVVHADARALHWAGRMARFQHDDEREVAVWAWRRLILFRIDQANRVHLITRVRVKHAGKPDIVVDLPQAQSPPLATAPPELEWTYEFP